MFELTKETRNELLNKITVLLDGYGYYYDKYALLSIIDTWADNKRNLIELFMKHPDTTPVTVHLSKDESEVKQAERILITETIDDGSISTIYKLVPVDHFEAYAAKQVQTFCETYGLDYEKWIRQQAWDDSAFIPEENIYVSQSGCNVSLAIHSKKAQLRLK